MPGLYTRILKFVPRYHTLVADGFKMSCNSTTPINTWNKRAIGMVGVGILTVPLIACKIYVQKKQFCVYDTTIIFIMRGKLVGDFKTEVGPNGTTCEYRTDLGLPYHNEYKEYTNKEYQYLPWKERNPKNIYHKKEDMTVILLGLSKKEKPKGSSTILQQ